MPSRTPRSPSMGFCSTSRATASSRVWWRSSRWFRESSRATCTASSVWFGRNSWSGGSMRRIVTGRPSISRRISAKSCALQRQQLGQCRLPGGFVGGKDQPLDQLAPRAEEHVLGPAQARPRRRRTDGRARRPPRYRRWPARPCGVPGRRGRITKATASTRPSVSSAPRVPSRCRSTGESVTGTAPRNTSPVVPSIETTSPSRMVRPATRTSLRATSMSSCSAPHTQVRPIPRATTAACEVLPPRRSAPHAPRSCRAGRPGWSRGGRARRRRRGLPMSPPCPT